MLRYVYFNSGTSYCVNGHLYLVPTDTKLEETNTDSFAVNLFPFEYLLNGLKTEVITKGSSNLVLLDSCSGTCRLPSVPDETIVFDAGELAVEAEGKRNSVLTESLLAHLGEREELQIILSKIRKLVSEQTAGLSVPRINSNMSSLFYLAGMPNQKESQKVSSSAPPAPAATIENASETPTAPPVTEAIPSTQPPLPSEPVKE